MSGALGPVLRVAEVWNGSNLSLPSHEYLPLTLIPIPLAATFGNLLVMFAVATRSELQTSTGMLIFSMAVSDAVLGTFPPPAPSTF